MPERGLAESGNNVHAHRQVAKVLTDPEVTKRLFTEIAPRFAERKGGYTRIVKVGQRLGDGAEMVMLELVEKAAPAAEGKEGKGKDKDAKAKDKGTKAKRTPAKADESKSKGKDARAKGNPAQSGDTKAKGKVAKGKETKAPSK